MTTYKTCAVPMCRSTTIKCPGKLFIHVPNKSLRRKQWLQLARRNSKCTSDKSPIYFCEDHFDLPNDMENYMQYYLMGSVSQVRMKPGCVPTKFQCQPDRKKRTGNGKERSYVLKKQRKRLIEECERDLEKRSIATKRSKFEETPVLEISIESIKQEYADDTVDGSVQEHTAPKYRSTAVQTDTEIELPINIGNIKQEDVHKTAEKSIQVYMTPECRSAAVQTDTEIVLPAKIENIKQEHICDTVDD